MKKLDKTVVNESKLIEKIDFGVQLLSVIAHSYKKEYGENFHASFLESVGVSLIIEAKQQAPSLERAQEELIDLMSVMQDAVNSLFDKKETK
jgi:hypothetical protein